MAGISGVSAGIVLAGRYTLSRRLWHRGIGELWLASDSVRRRRVWIQISASGGLENAVSALTHVEHPAIAIVREAGQKRIAHEDRVVTDHVQHSHKLIHKSDSYIEFAVYDQDKGSSLTTRLMKGALTPAEIASVALNTAEVFEHVHAAGLVHGWLHTDSIWIGGKADVFVDLALGLAFEGDAAAVAAEAASGFLTSERLGGAAATAADDVYGLAWLLYAGVFGWQIVTEDLALARGEAAAGGFGGGVAAAGAAAAVAGVGVASASDAALLLAYRREIAVGRLTEYFGESSSLAEIFALSLSEEASARPSMAEVVEALRAQPLADLPQPAVVVERAAAAAAAFALAAGAAEVAEVAEAASDSDSESLAESVEDADSGAWTPAVSPTAGASRKGTTSLAEAEAATAVAVAAALAEAEERHCAELAAAEERHASARAESRIEAEELVVAAAVAAAVAEVEARHRAEMEAAEAGQAAAVEAAVVAALAEAAVAHAAEVEAARAEVAAAAEAKQAAAVEAASALAVTAALAEMAANAETQQLPAQRSAGAGAVAGGAVGLLIGAELAGSEAAAAAAAAGAAGATTSAAVGATAATASGAILTATESGAILAAGGGAAGGSAAAAASSPKPKPKPWILASGGIILGVVVGIGIGYAVHGSSSSSTSTTNTSTSTTASATLPAGGSTGSVTGTASGPGASASSSTGSSAGAPTTAPSDTTGSSGGASSSAPSAGASTSAPGAGPTTPGTVPSAPNTVPSNTVPSNTAPSNTASSNGAPAQPTTPRQSETQITTIITTQVTNSGAKSTLTGIINQLKATQAGSSSYNLALSAFNQTITSLENQGSISHSTAEALRQQATYLQGFSGS